jgi:glycosyltransferase involved in cell wall biosynthesis
MSTNPVEISAAVATRNRADFLGPCLTSICEQTLAPERYELCVFDNASTDHTVAVVKNIQQRYPHHTIKLFSVPTVGVSYARNAALEHCQAPYVSFGDDDATMPRDWLERYLNGFNTLGPDLGKMAGDIIPVWQAPRPDWITDFMLPNLSAGTGLKTEAHFCAHPLMESSCYRREAVIKAGGFPHELGRRGNLLLSGENAIDIVMTTQGWKLYYDPAIVIYHTIHANRLTPAWMRQRFFWQGVSDFATIAYLKKRGILVNEPTSFTLPFSAQDYAFVNNRNQIPDADNLIKIRALGHILAHSGLVDVT